MEKKPYGLTTPLLDEGRLRYAINNLNKDDKKIRTRQERWGELARWPSPILEKNLPLHLTDAEKKSPSHRCWLAPNGSSGRKKCGSARNEYVREEGSLSISNHIVKIHRTDLSRRGSSCTALCYISLFLGC